MSFCALYRGAAANESFDVHHDFVPLICYIIFFSHILGTQAQERYFSVLIFDT